MTCGRDGPDCVLVWPAAMNDDCMGLRAITRNARLRASALRAAIRRGVELAGMSTDTNCTGAGARLGRERLVRRGETGRTPGQLTALKRARAKGAGCVAHHSGATGRSRPCYSRNTPTHIRKSRRRSNTNQNGALAAISAEGARFDSLNAQVGGSCDWRKRPPRKSATERRTTRPPLRQVCQGGRHSRQPWTERTRPAAELGI
jgi:hypothetical protein